MLDLWGQRRPMRLNTWYDKVKWNDIFIFFGLMLLVGTANLVRESILLLFNPLLDPARPVSGRYPPLLTAFVCAHGVYIASSNYAAIFDFGQSDAIIPRMFEPEVLQETPSQARFESSRRFWESHLSLEQDVHSQQDGPRSEDDRFSSSIQVLSFASHLAFSTLRIILGRIGDENVLPSVHLSFAFLWSMALVPTSMTYIEADVPWVQIASFLNTLVQPDMDMSKAEDEQFPSDETGSSRQLPEDFLIRGQAWSQLY
ncbi:hypothetical protein KXV68_005220 [Aspergillus fumigatus]|nr:hypothetical protein KXX67_008371 [Aspergillus fumigatus]KAH1596641.1 hypothetical protein KXX44_006477 [Aspergillus fumigatus]KAH1659461.1 hypothetical protein KXX15_002534 [Aspergillus fumigatus]KAH1727834.1 hypothetical protein KXX25_008454 [Aspergillus fumigatus]KAH1732358.1 hypothetical protein KXX40_008252 [Aspergillus fumigatus]